MNQINSLQQDNYSQAANEVRRDFKNRIQSPIKAQLQEVRVFAPATVANMICGFDILGFALDEPGDEVLMRVSTEPGVRIVQITGDQGKLPVDPLKNTVSLSVMNYLEALQISNVGLEITLHKHMPIGSGLGSSAASTIAGLVAVNALFGDPLSKKELLPFAIQGEAMACGNGHADNVAPSLLGGITLIRSYTPLDVINLPVPSDLMATVIYPHVEVPTREARKLLRKQIELQDAVKHWGNIAGLVTALFQNDKDLLARSMQDDLIEPARSILIPSFYAMKELALKNGAYCFGISGSGPSVFALSPNRETAEQLKTVLLKELSNQQIGADAYVSAINTQGPRILDQQ